MLAMRRSFEQTNALVLLTVLVGQFALQAQIQDPSLKLHFNFDQGFLNSKVVDVSSNGNDGWQFNQTNLLSAGAGVFGSQAGQFTYVGYMSNDPPHVYSFSQYIGVTNLNGFAYLTNATISFWAKFDTNTDFGMYVLDTGYSAIYAQNPSAASNSWTLGRYNTPYLCFVTFPSDGSADRIVSWPDDTVQSGGYTPNLSTTRFHLYTVTIDCVANSATSYYDGVPYMSVPIGLPWIRIYGCSAIRWLCIGAMSHDGTPQWGDDNYPNSGFFVGRLDDLRIYNRTLSAPEVQSLYVGSTYARTPTIQFTGPNWVQISWPTSPNVGYQVEYQLNLSGGTWNALGLPIVGNGQTNSVSDSTLGSASRYYRIRILPQ